MSGGIVWVMYPLVPHCLVGRIISLDFESGWASGERYGAKVGRRG